MREAAAEAREVEEYEADAHRSHDKVIMGCAEWSSLSPLFLFLEPPLGLAVSCSARVRLRVSIFWCFLMGWWWDGGRGQEE